MKKSLVSPPSLETDLLCIRFITIDDAPTLLAFHRENEIHLKPWTPIPTEDFYTLEFWENKARQALYEWQEERSLHFGIFLKESPNRIIGSISCTQIVRGPFQACILGYQISHTHEGKGLMKIALREVISFVFNEMNLHRIMANYMPNNIRSGKLLTNLGFEVEGLAKNYLMINGKWEDHVLTSLINKNFSEII